MSVVKLTVPDMLQIASNLQTTAEDYQRTFQQLATTAEEMAATTMQGLAGPAIHAKAAELSTQVARHSQLAMEKAAGIQQFANRTVDAETEKQSRISAISGL